MSDLRLAILGCGQIVRTVHFAALQRLPDVRVVALAEEQSSGRDWAAAHLPHASIHGDYRELLAGTEFDAVLVALPTALHADAAIRAFARGAHVYLEKPIAASVTEADAVVAAWERAGTTGRIGFNARFNSLYRELRASLSRGDIGRPLVVRSTFTTPWPSDGGWHTSVGASGGALFELASHHIDLLRWICNSDVLRVQASVWPVRDGDEAACLQLQLATGIRAQVFAAHGTVAEERFEVYGETGKLVVDRYDSLRVRRTALRAAGGFRAAVQGLVAEMRALPYAFEKRRNPGHEPSYVASLSAFVESARSGMDGSPDLYDGRIVQRILVAARDSASRGMSIDIAPTEPARQDRKVLPSPQQR